MIEKNNETELWFSEKKISGKTVKDKIVNTQIANIRNETGVSLPDPEAI